MNFERMGTASGSLSHKISETSREALWAAAFGSKAHRTMKWIEILELKLYWGADANFKP